MRYTDNMQGHPRKERRWFRRLAHKADRQLSPFDRVFATTAAGAVAGAAFGHIWTGILGAAAGLYLGLTAEQDRTRRD